MGARIGSNERTNVREERDFFSCSGSPAGNAINERFVLDLIKVLNKSGYYEKVSLKSMQAVKSTNSANLVKEFTLSCLVIEEIANDKKGGKKWR